MSSILQQGFSLSDFAETVTDDIKELKSLLPPAGVFIVKINEAQLGENEAKEGIDDKTGEPYLPLFFLGFKYEVAEAKPLDKDLDPDSLIGRVINDRYTFWPSNFSDMIGLLKGRYAKVGFDNTGRLGGLEGGEPGWIDNAIEQVIGLKISHRTKNGNTNAFFDWVDIREPAEA